MLIMASSTLQRHDGLISTVIDIQTSQYHWACAFRRQCAVYSIFYMVRNCKCRFPCRLPASFENLLRPCYPVTGPALYMLCSHTAVRLRPAKRSSSLHLPVCVQ